MRLLHTRTFELREFLGDDIPEYAILSHTWGTDEVTFQDMSTGPERELKWGWLKIQFCCRQADSDGLSWAWIDTCCIDKTSSAELSESVNSMYKWYKNAWVCYVYLQDCHNQLGFLGCRWWTRGWTLQELIAPSCVEFYDATWKEMGSKQSMHEYVTRATGIDEKILRGGDIFQQNVAVRMSWAARRETTRVEDQAYCLLGLFGVNMPLLYGEGDRAFKRLQEEILKVSEDYTLFTWSTDDQITSQGLLADRPRDFIPRTRSEMGSCRSCFELTNPQFQTGLARDCFSVFPPPSDHETPYMTSRGLHLTLPVWQSEEGRPRFMVCITVSKQKNHEELVCVPLIRLPQNQMRRERGQDLTLIPRSEQFRFAYETFYVTESRAESKVRTLLAGDEMSAMLLVVKLQGFYSEQLSCNFSPWAWASIMDLIQLDEKHSSGKAWSPIRVDTAADLRLFDLRSLLASIESRRGKEERQSLREEFLKECFGNAPEHCWLVEDRIKFVANDPHIQGVLCFRHEVFEYCAFQIQIGLYERKAVCHAIPAKSDALQDEATHQKWLQDAYSAILSTDRTTIRLASTDKHTKFLPSLKFAVSIRRVATSPLGFRRYVLSITDMPSN